jgi:dienelactone hydrolase
MLERAFHAWERRLVAVSKDRVVRPFEWGLDWLPANGHQTATGAPRDAILRWAAETVQESERFFAVTPTSSYVVSPSQTPEPDEAGTLTFESALETPDKENNTVYARWFPARGEPSIRRAVLVLPQWNADAGGHVGLCRLLARCGISALRLSLPYHDLRMPRYLTRADFIVSSNVVRTVQVCRQAVLDARRAIMWLAGQGFERIGMLGTSLGSCLSLLTTAHEPLVRVQALNHISPYFADVVWRGISTAHVRAGFDGHIDLNDLRSMWMPISPQAYLDRVRDRRTLLVYAKHDLTFPVDLSKALVEEFRSRQIPHEVVVLPCGHYSTGKAPFKFLDGWALMRFLRLNL